MLVFWEICTKDSKTPMEQTLKESFYICRYSAQELDGMNKHAGFLRDLYKRWKSQIEQKLRIVSISVDILYKNPEERMSMLVYWKICTRDGKPQWNKNQGKVFTSIYILHKNQAE